MDKETNINSLLKKGIISASTALMFMSSIQPCVISAAETTTFSSDRPAGFYDSLFEVDKWGDLSISVLRNNDVYRNVAFCMAKQKYFPTQDGVEYKNNLDPSTWAWGRGDGTYVDQDIVRQVRNIMYAYNFEFNKKLGDYGLEGDTMSLYSATSIALWAIIEGFTPNDLKIQSEATGEARSIAEKQLPLIRDLYARKDVEGYQSGATLKNITNGNTTVEATYDITSDHVYQLSDENYYYRSPLLSLRPNQKDGVVFDGDQAFEYVVTLEGAPEGTLITDEKANVISDGKFGYDLAQGSDFYVYVPIYGEDDGQLTVKVDTTKLARMDLQLWTPTSSSGYQDIMSNALVSDSANATTKLTWKVEEKPVTPPTQDSHYGRIELTKVGQQPIDVQKSKTEYGELNTIKYREEVLPNVGFDFYYNNMIIDAQGVMHFKNEKITRKPIYTSQAGRIVYSGLPMDQNGQTQYRIEEVNIPEGYRVTDVNTITTIDTANKTSKIKIVNEMIKLNLSIQKTGKNGTSLAGATFGLYNKEAIQLKDGNEVAAGSLVAILTSDDKGLITTNNVVLPASIDYQLKELKAPEGYKLNETIYDVIVDANTGNATLKNGEQEIESIPNIAIMEGKIEITKVDVSDNPSGNPLANVTFTLYEDGKEKSSATTNEAGKAEFGGLTEGHKYVLKESVLQGYEPVNDFGPYEITEYEQTISVRIENRRQIIKPDGKISIVKQDATDPNNKTPMSGVTFNLFANSVKVDSAITNDNGIAEFSGLELNKEYTVEEIVPDGYQEPETIKPIRLTNDNNEIRITVENHKIPEERGSIIINKKDATDAKNPIAMVGVVFNLYDADHKLIESTQTNSKGIATFTNLKLGVAYTIEEEVPDGYLTPEEIAPITLSEEKANVTITVNNIKEPEKLGSITIRKSDSVTGEAMSDVTFTLYDDKGYQLDSKKTNGKGIVSFNNLQLDKTYVIKETTPEGYQEATEIKPIVLSKENADITLEIENTPLDIRGSIKIVKFDKENNKLLQGAKFTLYAYDDKDFSDPLDTVTSDSKGEVWFRNLKPGRYVAVEKEAPSGYRLDKNVINIDLRDIVDGAVKSVDFANERLKTNITLIKHDSKDSNIKVSGAKYGLYTEDMKFIKDGVTDKNGKIDFGEVEFNTTYKIKELSAAENYKLDDFIYTVKTSDLSKDNYELKVEDDPILGSIVIKKVDSRNSDKKLEGAVFTLYYKDDTDFSDAIASVKTDSNGYAAFNNLRMADYAIKETRAPKDYKGSDSVYYVTVKDLKEGSIELMVKNEPKNPNVPSTPEKNDKDNKKPTNSNPAPQINTGEVGMNIVLPTIALALGVGCVLYFSLKKKKKD